jgi:hypothetical protein
MENKTMSNKTETKKLNKLAVKKETISDLDVNNAGEVKGGPATVQATAAIQCNIAPKTGVPGVRCDTGRILCPGQY